MSVAGISGSNFFQPYFTPSAQKTLQQIQSQFQQLGQDLQAGNLAQAQADFATLTQELPSAQQQSSAATNTNSIAQEFQTLGQDLQAGNLTAAQQDFATIQQDAQLASASGQTQTHHHGHHHGASSTQQESNTLAQAFGALGQALQSGNLSSAQQAYASLQQDLQQFLPNFSSSSASTIGASLPSPGSVSVNA
jgi:protein subunit release factor A